MNDVIVEALEDRFPLRKGSPTMATTNRSRRPDDGKVRVAIIGIGNCASARAGSSTTRTPAGTSSSPASCTSTSAATTSATSSSPPRSTSRRTRSARTWPTRSGRTEQHGQVRRRSENGRPRLPRDDARRPRRVRQRDRREGARRDRRRGRDPAQTGTDVVVNFLPVGSEAATKWYAEQILDAGCAMVNCMPIFIGREAAYWRSGSSRPASRSSATTSSRRWARRSLTGC